MAVSLAARKDPEARAFALAAGVFTVSLVFRTIDEALCQTFPVGTHFLWHLCNAAMLYLLLVALIRSASGPD
jgi:hypothetical protein